MLWHIVMEMREQNADVMFLSDLSTPEWMSEGNKVVMLGLEEYTLFVNGMVGIVLSRLFVKMWQSSGSTVHTAGNKRWIGLTVRMGVSRYHLVSHNMPTQSGGSAHGPRHEHLEHGTELLSKLKRSGDHVILRGDANSLLEPDERLNGFVGRFTTQIPSSRLSWQFVEWCVQEGLSHVDSYLSCRRRGTWYHNFVGKWYEQDVIVSTLGGDGKRWRRRLLEVTTGENGYLFCPWDGMNTSSILLG